MSAEKLCARSLGCYAAIEHLISGGCIHRWSHTYLKLYLGDSLAK